MKRFLSLVALLALVGASCTRGGEVAAPGDEAGLSIYVVVHGGSGDPYWQIVRKGVEDAEERYGIDITWLNPEEFSIERLVDLLNSAVAANPDGIIASITDPEAVDPPLRQAINNGIPVIAIDVPDDRPLEQRVPYLFYIGGDEFLAGQIAARRMLDARPVERAVCALHEFGNLALEMRCDGFRDVMEGAGVTVENLDVGLDPGRVQAALESYLAANPETNAILTLGPLGAIPTIQFLSDNNLWEQVVHGTFDLDPNTNESVKNGETLFLIDTQPYLMGYLAVMMMFMHNTYQFGLSADIPTGPAVIDATNIEDVEELSEQRIR